MGSYVSCRRVGLSSGVSSFFGHRRGNRTRDWRVPRRLGRGVREEQFDLTLIPLYQGAPAPPW
jgi:hypothetical protein